jgi:ankyrin repeat protein
MADVNAFHASVKSGDLEAVRTALADDPALLNAKNEAGQSAILLSCYYGRHELANYLLSMGPALDIFTAAAVGQQSTVLKELERDPALIGTHSSDGWTPLHITSFFGHEDLTLKLIERGAEVDARSTNAMKNTPLHAAAAGRKLNIVKLLLAEGANANATQEGGWTALHAAAQNGDRETVEALLAHGADVNARAENKQSALDLALLKGRQEVAQLLETLGAGT